MAKVKTPVLELVSNRDRITVWFNGEFVAMCEKIDIEAGHATLKVPFEWCRFVKEPTRNAAEG